MMILSAPAFAGVGMITAVLSHVLASRAGAGPLMAYARSLIAGGLITVILCVAGYHWDVVDVWAALAALLLFAAWWFIFLNVVQALESSIRVRLVREMLAAGGALPRAQLEASYNDEGLIRLRLERLQAGGAMTERGGRLFITSASTYRLARFFRLLKVILLGRRSEFAAASSRPCSGAL